MELFGGVPDSVKFIIVFLLILGILVPLLWRRFNMGTLGMSSSRGRQNRLAVIDSAAVDVRRRLVLIKRDNVEHLLMIGGPSDIVVESNIARTPAGTREPRPIPDARTDAARQPPVAETPEWSLPLEPMARPVRTVDLDAALPEPPARTAREAMVDSMRAVRSSGAAARRNPPMDLDNPPEEIVAPALTPPPPGEINHRPPPIPDLRPDPRRAPPAPEPQRSQSDQQRPPEPVPPPVIDAPPEPKRERAAPPAGPRAVPTAAATANVPPPPPRPVQPVPPAAVPASAVPPPPRPSPSDESNLAEMAQRLEAALRRPTKPEPPPPPPPMRATLRPEPPQGRRPAPLDGGGPKKGGAKLQDSSPPDLKILSGKGKNESALDSLEDEMARMLGRPGKS